MKKLLILSILYLISVNIVLSGINKRVLRILQENSQNGELTILDTADDTSNQTISKQEDKEPIQEELLVPRYKSALIESERKEYMKWVEFKNSLNTNEGQLAKLTKYFAPEDTSYYTTIYKSGWPFYSLAGIIGFFLIVYLILRFGFRYCLGPKQHITSFYGFFTWTLIRKNINRYKK